MVHCVAIWAFGCSRQLCRDKNRYVATGFPGKLGGLSRDREFSVRTKNCWPRVTTGNAVSGLGLGLSGLGRDGDFLVATKLVGQLGLLRVMTQILCHDKGTGSWVVFFF